MKQQEGSSYDPQDRPRAATITAALLALVEVLIDAATWIQLDVAAIYGLPLVLGARARSPHMLWILTALLVGATFGVYAVQVPVGTFAITEPFFVNRILYAIAVTLTAGLLHVWMRSLQVLGIQTRLLKSKNVELLDQRQQIERQNMELERRRIEADMASARKTILLAAASHDIRTPVSTINMMAELIRRTAESPALAVRIPELTARLQASASELVQLVSAVLDTAHFESGQAPYNESVFVVNDLLLSTYHAFLPIARERSLSLRIEVTDEALWVRTDRVKLQRVISNLASNAIKFTEAGAVTIRARNATDGALVIPVSDTGIGMAPRKLARIFDDFAQLEAPQQSEPRGWGLGLAICRRLVDIMGGTITVETELNEGSSFTVRLPAQCLVHIPEASVPHSPVAVC